MENLMSVSAASLLAPAANVHQHARVGTVDDSTDGEGSFATLISKQGNTKTIDTIETFADGQSRSRDTTITANGDGSKTVDTTKTKANGKTVTVEKNVAIASDGSKTVDRVKTKADGATVATDETYTPNADGSETVSGTKTVSNGSMDKVVAQISGTVTHSAYGKSENLTITNGDGQTKTLDIETSHTHGHFSRSVTGTDYAGNAIDRWQTRDWQKVSG